MYVAQNLKNKITINWSNFYIFVIEQSKPFQKSPRKGTLSKNSFRDNISYLA